MLDSWPVIGRRPHDHITQVLKNLHWLPVKFRIKYKVCLLMHMVHTGQCPSYPANTVVLTAISNSCTGLHLGSTQRYTQSRVHTKIDNLWLNIDRIDLK